jgi:hypothetical protein
VAELVFANAAGAIADAGEGLMGALDAFVEPVDELVDAFGAIELLLASETDALDALLGAATEELDALLGTPADELAAPFAWTSDELDPFPGSCSEAAAAFELARASEPRDEPARAADRAGSIAPAVVAST